MPKSASVAKITKAIMEVQQGVEPVARTMTGQIGNRTYKYADLNSVWSAVRPLLRDAGLVVVQMPSGDGLTTLIMHESGEFIEETMRMAHPGNDPQAQGSAITYARRYALSAAFGIIAEDDDDAAGAMASAHGRVTSPTPASVPRSQHTVQEVVRAIQAAESASEILGLQEKFTEAMGSFNVSQRKQVKEARDARLQELAKNLISDDDLPF